MSVVGERSKKRRARYTAVSGTVLAVGLGAAIASQSGSLSGAEISAGSNPTAVADDLILPSDIGSISAFEPAIQAADSTYSTETISVLATLWGVDSDTARIVAGLQILQPQNDTAGLTFEAATERKTLSQKRFEESAYFADAEDIAEIWGVDEDVVASVVGTKLEGDGVVFEENLTSTMFITSSVDIFNDSGYSFEEAEELQEAWGVSTPIGAKVILMNLGAGNVSPDGIPIPLEATSLYLDSLAKLESGDVRPEQVTSQAEAWGTTETVAQILIAATI